MGVSILKPKSQAKSGFTLPSNGPMLGLDLIDVGTFASDDFQSQRWYQGCGTVVESDKPTELANRVHELEKTGEWYAEPKADGINISVFSDGKRNRFWSRNSLEKEYGLVDMPLPAGTLLIGELGAGSEYALERRAKLGHDFVDVHGILVVNYKPILHLNEIERRDALEEFYSGLDKNLCKHFMLMSRWTDKFSERITKEHEGLVLKRKDSGPYIGRGAKPSYWMKAKKWFESDMVVMEIRLSNAKTKTTVPMVKDLTCGQYVDGVLKPLTSVGGGITDAMSREIAANFEQYRGKVVKLYHNGQFKSGALRHAGIIGFRDDKDPEDCTFDPNSLGEVDA
jgi:ATP-dependent DNA ligase